TGNVCGDGVPDGTVETCDDGNGQDGDGCSAGCQIETSWRCDGAPSSCERVDTDDDGVPEDGDASGLTNDAPCSGGRMPSGGPKLTDAQLNCVLEAIAAQAN
ncbi:MAG: hypothetical protein KC417_14860, partial [Myxococcales bacterium]|nr:hypothetical protein [Myxococcales bacterium]